MRPTEILTLAAGVVVGLGGIVLSVLLLVWNRQSAPWHYWIAPFMMIAVGGLLVQVAAGFMVKVARPARRGRPSQ